MPFSTATLAGRILPPRLFARLEPGILKVDAVLTGSGEHAVAQRIAAITFTVRIFGAAIAYLSQILLARWLGGYEYGIFVVVWTWVLILGAVVHLGFGNAVIRLIPEYVATGKTAHLRGLLFGSRAIGFVSATAIAGLGALGVFVFEDLLSDHYVLPVYLAIVCVPLFTLNEVQDGISRAFSWANLALLPTYVVRPLLILAFAVAIAAAGYDLDAAGTCLAAIAATYVTAIGQLFVLNRRLRRDVEAGPRRFEPFAWLNIALPILLVDGFFVLLTGMDVIILGQLQSPDQVAVYFAAAKTLALVHFVYYAVKTGSAHHYSKFHHSGDRGGLERFVAETVKWTFWPSLICAVFVLIIGRPLLSLFGEGFESGYGLLFILVLGVLARAALGPVEALLTMAGYQKIAAVVYGGTLAANVALCLLLIPPFGLYGAAFAMTLSLIGESVVLYIVARWRLDLHVFVIRRRRAASAAESPAE